MEKIEPKYNARHQTKLIPTSYKTDNSAQNLHLPTCVNKKSYGFQIKKILKNEKKFWYFKRHFK